jgi:hypothetical protein
MAYENVWAAVLEIVDRHARTERSLSRAMRLTEAEWLGSGLEPADGTAYGRAVRMPSAALHGARRALRSRVLATAMPDATAVVELGSGWGNNLIDLYLAGGPRVPYFALEPTSSGRAAAERLAALEPALDLTACAFDLTAPDYGSLPRGRVLVFTSHAIEQVRKLPDEAITGLLDLGEVLCVHFEPIGWQIREGAEVGATREYSQANDYNENLWPLLEGLAQRGEIVIETVEPDIVHHKTWNASSLVIWRSVTEGRVVTG